MSEAKIYEYGSWSDKNLTDMSFPDIKKYLERHLENSMTLPDLDNLKLQTNTLIKSGNFLNEELSSLKKLRQRIYDRKPKIRSGSVRSDNQTKTRCRKFKSDVQLRAKVQTAKNEVTKNNDPEKISHMTLSVPGDLMPKTLSTNSSIVISNEHKTEFFLGMKKALLSIDGETFIKNVPRIIAWFGAAALVSFFLMQQSITLYQSTGFKNAIYAATGGLLMVAGFAAYHSITRSWLALLFCLYAGAYEGYLMISGTVHQEKEVLVNAVEANPELIFLNEKAIKEKDRYEEIKQRYDNPDSKVFKSEWFLKKHVNPAWEKNVEAQAELLTKKATLMTEFNNGDITWLKICYRLGLVFLCMLFVHRFFSVLRT